MPFWHDESSPTLVKWLQPVNYPVGAGASRSSQIDQSRINLFSLGHMQLHNNYGEMCRSYTIFAVLTACTLYTYKQSCGLILIIFILRQQRLFPGSPPWDCHLQLGRYGHLSGSPLGRPTSWSPVGLAGRRHAIVGHLPPCQGGGHPAPWVGDQRWTALVT